ncbi:MAG TPA: RNA 2',3'-cyclic phosphodiesterase [Opitutaceae bacterium]|nr:RNA 2',3'-cyclic phosphodiesterase [Opitutaceae bacterium]
MRSSASSNAPDSSAAPAPLRLFVAIDAPAPVAAALAALAQPLPGFAWTPPKRLHLTLRFLGDTPAEKLEPLRARLHAIRVARFLLPVEGLGVFPPRGQPRVLWCGVGGGHPHLQQLRQRIDDSVLATGLDADLRSFVPHFTLARLGVVPPARVAQWLREHRDFAAPPFRVGQFTLYSSELRPSGAVHTALETFPLAER